MLKLRRGSDRLIEALEPGKHYERFMCAIIGIPPPLGHGRFKELGQQTIRAYVATGGGLEHARALKLGDALKLVP